QGARSAPFAHEFALLDGIDEHAGSFHRRHRRPERSEAETGRDEHDEETRAVEHLAAAFALLEFGACNVHARFLAGCVPSTANGVKAAVPRESGGSGPTRCPLVDSV